MINDQQLRKDLLLKPTDKILVLVISEIGGYSNGFIYDVDKTGIKKFEGAFMRDKNNTLKATGRLTEFIKTNLGSLKDRGLI